jgi:holo-[acyl-carrier protein] synthase
VIIGVGTDIVSIGRIRASLERHGEAFAERILTGTELDEFRAVHDGARLLAKRFAAKEAFAKAFGTGLRPPVGFHAVGVGHDELGKPLFALSAELGEILRLRGWRAHLSISDEKEAVVAFALIDGPDNPLPAEQK